MNAPSLNKSLLLFPPTYTAPPSFLALLLTKNAVKLLFREIPLTVNAPPFIAAALFEKMTNSKELSLKFPFILIAPPFVVTVLLANKEFLKLLSCAFPSTNIAPPP